MPFDLNHYLRYMSARDFLLEFKNTRDFKVSNRLLYNDAAFREELFEQVTSDEYPFPEYSSWIAIHFFKRHPKFFSEEFCTDFIRVLFKTDNHTVQRNLCAVLVFYKGNLSENVELLDKLFFFLTDKETLPALRVHALRNLEKHFLKRYPELIAEISSAFELLEEYQQPSIRAMIRNFRKKHKLH